MSEESDNDYNNEGAHVMPGFSDEDGSYEVSAWMNSVMWPFRKREEEVVVWWVFSPRKRAVVGVNGFG